MPSWILPRSALVIVLVAFGFTGPHTVSAQTVVEAMAAAIGSAESRRAIAGLATRADGTGPRGTFTTEIVSHGDAVRFVQVRDGRQAALVVVRDVAYGRDDPSAPMRATSGPEASVVHGHDLHRLLLDLERRLHVDSTDSATGCVNGTTAAGRVTLCRSAGDGRPARLTMTPAGSPESIVVEFGDWRRVHGVMLPFTIEYLQGGSRFTHRFRAVMPFTLAPGVEVPLEPGAAFDRLGDLAGLAALHRGAIDAHLASDVSALAAGEFERSTVSRRGELVETTRDGLVARLGPYLASIRFTRYEDVRVPVIAVSDDGSLGWVACEIEAEGREVVAGRPGSAVAYAFSWVEMAIKTGGRWLRNGNASSARP